MIKLRFLRFTASLALRLAGGKKSGASESNQSEGTFVSRNHRQFVVSVEFGKFVIIHNVISFGRHLSCHPMSKRQKFGMTKRQAVEVKTRRNQHIRAWIIRWT